MPYQIQNTMNPKAKQNKENHFYLFTASSFDPRLRIGAGCSLILEAKVFATLKCDDLGTLPLVTKDFKEITATSLELETLIWAIEAFHAESNSPQLTVCSDFKSTKDLLQRRQKLEQTNYAGSKPGTTLAHADIYKRLFKLHDRLSFEIYFIEAAACDSKKDFRQVLFLRVSQQAQQALKNQLKAQNQVANKWF